MVCSEERGVSMDDNKKFWDRCARFYTGIQQRSNRRLYEDLNRMCMSHLKKDMDVLELACGTGQFTYPLCDLVHSWTATDFSEAMLTQAKKRPCSAVFTLRDATALPDGNRQYDLVLMGNALHIMPQPGKALSEIHRVLKDGGIFLAPTFVYEGKVNRFRMALTNLAGFRTCHKWDSQGLTAFVEGSGFRCISAELLPGDPLPVSFAVFRKI